MRSKEIQPLPTIVMICRYVRHIARRLIEWDALEPDDHQGNSKTNRPRNGQPKCVPSIARALQLTSELQPLCTSQRSSSVVPFYSIWSGNKYYYTVLLLGHFYHAADEMIALGRFGCLLTHSRTHARVKNAENTRTVVV